MSGKSIKIFLIEGTPNQRLYCELSNWNGRIYRIPRNEIKKSEDRRDLQNTGVYVLLGKNDDGKILAYIGECDNIQDRLSQHLRQKDFWDEALVFIRTDNSLNKALVKHIERRLYDISTDVNRCIIMNGNQPGGASISEADIDEMEEFIENAKILTNALGIKIFESVISQTQTIQERQAKTLFIKNSSGASGMGQKTVDGFVVMKGSVITKSVKDSDSSTCRKLRDELISTGIITDLTFTKDYLFTSPSTAAGVLLGRSANGLNEWKTVNGQTLKSILEKA